MLLQKFELQLDVGSTAINYDEVAKKEHLSTLALEVRKLNDKVQDIIKSQNYQQVGKTVHLFIVSTRFISSYIWFANLYATQQREIEFRNTSESTNSRVQWWSIFQTIICVASGVWQTLHLKNYFRKKKLQ